MRLEGEDRVPAGRYRQAEHWTTQMKMMLIAAVAGILSGCSPEAPASGPASPALEAGAPAAAPVVARTRVLRDPTPMQIAVVVADWTGRPLDLAAAAERSPEYLAAAADEREAVLARLTAQGRAVAATAQGVGVLDLSVPVASATFVPSTQVYHLPIFLPGSTIDLGPSQRLRLSNAAAAYTLDMDSAAAQAMRTANVQPARVRLTTRIDQVRPTQYGAEVTGALQAFTLYDADGRAIGDAVVMSGA